MTVSLKRCCIASHIILCVDLVACLIQQITDWWNHYTIGSLVLWMIDWFIDGGIVMGHIGRQKPYVYTVPFEWAAMETKYKRTPMAWRIFTHTPRTHMCPELYTFLRTNWLLVQNAKQLMCTPSLSKHLPWKQNVHEPRGCDAFSRTRYELTCVRSCTLSCAQNGCASTDNTSKAYLRFWDTLQRTWCLAECHGLHVWWQLQT